jgi:uncharacterized protein YgbK (DUF1537 family)
MTSMTLHVAADDRTGALETAAALADRGGAPVPVAVWPDFPPGTGSTVVDLCSRHLTAEEAASRAATLRGSGPLAHKIDSTLRGNWAAELVARHRATGRAVLLVPALPALGRVCVNGVVTLDGRSVHEGAVGADARRAVSSSRPAEALRSWGVTVHELADMRAVLAWMGAPDGVAVADAADDATIDGIVHRWREVDGVIIAGTSAVIGAAVGAPPRHTGRRHVVQPPTLVVCGSLHPNARAQISHAAAAGAVVTDRFDPSVLRAMLQGTPVILRSPDAAGPVTDADALQIATGLVQEAGAVVESGHVGTLIVLGGDTAAALLGDALVVVHGSVRSGTALVESLVVDVPVITRAGGFGAVDALSELLWEKAS